MSIQQNCATSRRSKWRDSASRRNLNLRTAPLERSHCSFRLIRSPLFRLRRTAHRADVRLSHPRPFGPKPKIWPVFPSVSLYFAYFQTVLNWTFDVFLQFYRFNHPPQPTGLQHDRTALFYIPSATHFASSAFRSSLAFNSSSTLTIFG